MAVAIAYLAGIASPIAALVAGLLAAGGLLTVALDSISEGSSKYQFAVNGPKVNVAFASDMNGFIQQLRPRFGSIQEPCGASGDRKTVNSQKDLQTMPLGTGFDYNGFAHIGLIEDIIRDLNNFNVDTTVIENSSETTIQVWERCYDDDRQPVDVSDFETSGIH